MDYIHDNRTNILIEPASADGSLILALHGGFGNPTDFQIDIDLESVLTSSYIIYLDADDAMANLWRSGVNGVDVAYVHSLYQRLLTEFPDINADNVHLIGHSNGGMMCYKLAAFLDELNFKTITVLAGVYICPEVFDSQAKVLHIYGDEDNIVPPNGNTTYPPIADTKAKVKVAGTNPKFTEVLGMGHNIESIKLACPDLLYSIKQHMGL